MEEDIRTKEAIQLLRIRLDNELEPHLLTPKYDSDFNLLRWLQGYDFDLDIVVQKLRYHLRFRKAWDLDNIASSGIEKSFVYKAWPGGVVGPTGKSDNTLLRIDPNGKTDFIGLLKTASIPEIMRTLVLIFEKVLEEIMERERITGKQSGVVDLIDYDGLKFDASLVNIVTGPLKCLALFLPEHYVEMFQKFVMVNVPPCVYYLWKLLRPLLPEKTKQKVHILGKDWKKEILNFVEPGYLPRHWGGTMKGDSKCCAKVRMPTFLQVPKSMYWSERNPEFQSLQNYKSVLVPAGKTYTMTIHVGTVGSKIRFELSANNEFGFGVFYSEIDTDSNDVESLEMVWPQFLRFTGPTQVPFYENFACDKVGFYKFWFGNEFSWWSSLKLSVAIEIVQ